MQFEVFGDPAPQGSKKLVRGRIIEASGPKLKVWRKAIAEACVAARGGNNTFFTGPVQVVVTFYMPRGKTVKRQLPSVTPDLDKLLRGLLDGIGQSEMVWQDDSQVVHIVAQKLYADSREPGASVAIYAI